MPGSNRAQLDDLLAREDWGAVERLCEHHALRIALDAPDFWPRVFSRAPVDWVLTRPRLRHLRAVMHHFNVDVPFHEAAPMDGAGVNGAAEARSTVHDRLDELLQRMDGLLALGRLEDANSIADRMDEVISGTDELVGFGDLLPGMLIPMGTTRLVTGRLDDAISTFMTAVRWSLSGGAHPVERHARNFLALAYVLRGDVDRGRAEAASQEVDGAARAGTVGHGLERDTRLLPALIALADLDRETAEAVIGRLQTAENTTLWWMDSAVRARFALLWGDCEAAARRLELDLLAHRALAVPGSMARAMLHGLLADLRFATGDLDGARAALGHAADGPSGPWLEITRHRMSGGTLQPRQPSRTRAAHHVINAVASDRRQASTERDRHLELARRAMELDGDASAIVEASTQLGARLAASLGTRREAPHRFLGDGQQPEPLTSRELEIVEALRRHATIRAIAAELFLSSNTVKTHLRNAYRKLGVSTRTAALQAVDHVHAGGEAPKNSDRALGATSAG